MIESLALFKTDEEDIVDTTMPDFEMQKYRLGKTIFTYINISAITSVQPSLLAGCPVTLSNFQFL